MAAGRHVLNKCVELFKLIVYLLSSAGCLSTAHEVMSKWVNKFITGIDNLVVR